MKTQTAVALLTSSFFVHPFSLSAAQPAHERVADPVSVPVKGRENIEWSISYAYHLVDGKKNLPRVLLIGDSICNRYQNQVMKILEGKVNVSFWVSSYCATSDFYFDELDVMLKKDKYDVIHFNNGLHTSPKRSSVAQYEAAMEKTMRYIRERQPRAKLIWCSSTPLKEDAKGDAKTWVAQLNAAGARAAAKVGGVLTDDLFALMDPMDRKENWHDSYHHEPPACRMQAEQVAALVLKVVLDASRR